MLHRKSHLLQGEDEGSPNPNQFTFLQWSDCSHQSASPCFTHSAIVKATKEYKVWEFHVIFRMVILPKSVIEELSCIYRHFKPRKQLKSRLYLRVPNELRGCCSGGCICHSVFSFALALGSFLLPENLQKSTLFEKGPRFWNYLDSCTILLKRISLKKKKKKDGGCPRTRLPMMNQCSLWIRALEI